MRVIQLLLIITVTIHLSHGQWTWLSGTHDQNTVYARSNTPKMELANSTVGGRLGGVAWHGKNNDMWLFGGTGSATAFATVNIFSDVWHYSFDTGIWVWLGGGANQYFPTYTPPYSAGARSAFVSFVEDSENVLIFGGYAKSGYFWDMWRLTVDTANLTYSFTPIHGDDTRDLPVDYTSATPIPGGRAFSGGWRDAQGNVWIFGGNAYHNSTSVADSTNDLWMFNMTSLSWKFVGGPQNIRDPGHYSNDSLAWPGARNGYMTWSRNGEFWLFGGLEANGPNYNDVWKYANGMWTWVAGDDPSLKKLGRYGTKGIGTYYTAPGGRNQASLWVDSRGLVWIYGGIGVNEQSSTGDLQDVWVFNTTSRVFSWVDGTSTLELKANYSAMGVYSTATPSARAGHFCVPINDSYVWFYGGAQLNVYYNFYADMFSFNSTAITHQENYTIIAPVPPVTTTGSSQSSDNIVAPTKKSSNTAAIAAGVVVPIAVIAIAGIVVFLIWKKRREQKQNENVDMEKVYERKDSQYGTLSELSKYKQLSGIVIKDLLGVGNFGEVFRGLWNTTPIALKKLKDQAQFAAFQKEADLLCSLKNPYIVQYYGTYVDNNKFQYIVTELMTKGDAREFLIKNTQLKVKELTQMALEAAEGMAFIHAQNIIHRDLALRNLLVTESSGKYEVKVSDFGMAKMIEGQDSYYKSESNHHPIKWCSIETLKFGKYTFASDVWAYGILLWELFSYGASPYPGMTNVEAAEKVLEGYRMPIPENCPSDIFKLMSKCWIETPKERPTMDLIVLEIKSVLKTM